MWIYNKNLLNSDIMLNVYKTIIDNLNHKEKGFLIENKFLLKLKVVLFDWWGVDNHDMFYYKLSFLISRRLFFVYNDNAELIQNGKVSVYSLIDQIYTDLDLYIKLVSIRSKSVFELEEKVIKSYLFRILVKLSHIDSKIKISKDLKPHSPYILTSFYNADNIFIHFYSRVLLSPPLIDEYHNIIISGGYHYLNKRPVIEKNLLNKNISFKAEIFKFISEVNKRGFVLDKKSIGFEKIIVEDKNKRELENFYSKYKLEKKKMNLFQILLTYTF